MKKPVLLILLVCVAFGLSACEPSDHEVRYEADGTAHRVSLTWSTGDRGAEMAETVVPWSKTLTMGNGDFAHISVQNLEESGTVTCRILVDGLNWKESTSSGGHVIADCSGLVGKE